MSFGANDIVLGFKLAWRIYEYGWCEENRASVRYVVFMKDIQNFGHQLEKLDITLRHAQERYQLRAIGPFDQAYEPLAAGIEDERKNIIGNFKATLDECESLLQKNDEYRTQNSTKAQNILANVTQQEQKVDRLRARLQFHHQKISLVLGRLSVDLLTDLDARTDDILAVSDQTLNAARDIQVDLRRFHAAWAEHTVRGVQPTAPATERIISAEIAARFNQSLIDGPSLTTGLPLKEGFDALFTHHQRLTQILDPTDEKYLLHVKVRWLLDRLKESPEFETARPGYYYKCAINKVEQETRARFRSGELVEYDDAALLALEDSYFDVWPPTGPAIEDSQPDLLQTGPQEERIATVNLAMPGTSVTIFRSSDETLRVANKDSSEPGKTIITGQTILVWEDVLMPRYALPTLQSPCLELTVRCRNVETVYKFGTFDELRRFQTAMIGYDVSHDQNNIRCEFGKNLSSLDCEGRIQLWQDPISPATNSTPSMSGGSLGSPSQMSRRDSLSLAGTSTISPTATGWEGGRIKLPALAILTQLKKGEMKPRFAAIRVDLEPGIRVDQKACPCHRSWDTCKILVLTASDTKIKKFTVRSVYSDIDDRGLPVATTFNIFPLRTPGRARSPVHVTNHTKEMILRFNTAAEKQEFYAELNLRFQVRDRQIADQRKFESSFLHRADRPQGHQQDKPAALRQRQASSASDHSLASAPSLRRGSTQHTSLQMTSAIPEGTTAPPEHDTTPPSPTPRPRATMPLTLRTNERPDSSSRETTVRRLVAPQPVTSSSARKPAKRSIWNSL